MSSLTQSPGTASGAISRSISRTPSRADREAARRIGDLAYREGVSPAALSRVVAALERDGLVDRAADPEDRRSAFVVATEPGRDNLRTLQAARGAALLERILRLSVADRETLIAGLA